MFDVRKIKPVHGWRDFIGEVGIIVLGVTIALAAESLLEAWHWHRQVAQARDAFADDLDQDTFNVYERLAIAPCLRSRIAELQSKLRTSNGEWKADPAYRKVVDQNSAIIPPTYSVPARAYYTDSWKNVVSSGLFNHLTTETYDTYGAIFPEMDQLRDLQEQEAVTAAKLSPLSFDMRMSQRDRSDMIATLADADRELRLVDAMSSEAISELAGIKAVSSNEELRKAVKRMIASQRDYRGACVTVPPVKF